jgi:hypothetical protein
MQACGHRAVLVVTQTVEGTSTSVARRRVELRCSLPASHSGLHRDETQGEEWEGRPGHLPTLLRHEDEEREGE